MKMEGRREKRIEEKKEEVEVVIEKMEIWEREKSNNVMITGLRREKEGKSRVREMDERKDGDGSRS